MIKDFVDTYLGGNIGDLKNFDFSQLQRDKIYGCPGRPFDCDDTNLARSIYVLVYQQAFPDLAEKIIGILKDKMHNSLQVKSNGYDSEWRSVSVVKPKGSPLYKVVNNPSMYTQCKPVSFKCDDEYVDICHQ